jgi:hypothetical protein
MNFLLAFLQQKVSEICHLQNTLNFELSQLKEYSVIARVILGLF